jgi:CMP-N-acetylneuraminic acid synthetase
LARNNQSERRIGVVSIIIRTQNEERWISLCLKAVFSQDYKDFEVILVDNKSSDKTIAKANAFNIKVLNIDEYKPGKALNLGISVSQGEFICCLSGHCIPVNDKWLSNLVRNFTSKEIAGVYGRQEPMSFTSEFDKRDLVNLFGLDKKIQERDSFFHNANSIIRRDIWEKLPFDEQVTNIEDRIWAKEVLKQYYKIVYEPEASVYHYHGIHQDNDIKRCQDVVKILESIEPDKRKGLDIKNLNILALIPVKGQIQYLSGRPLIEYTIDRCKQSKFIQRVIVSTDNPELAQLAKKMGAESPFLRKKELSAEYVDLDRVLQFSLDEIEKLQIFPDVLAVLEITYPFRPKDLLDTMIQQLIDKGLDSVIPVRTEYKSCWINKNNEFKRIDQGFMPRSIKVPLYIGLMGLGCVTHPTFLREGNRLGDKVGFVEVADPFSAIEVRDSIDFVKADKLITDWWEQNK